MPPVPMCPKARAYIDSLLETLPWRNSTVFDRTEWVYFIRNPYVDRIKIGFTRDLPIRRLEAFENSSGCNFQPLGLIVAPKGLEKYLHFRFSKFRWRGEWYHGSELIMAFIASEAIPWTSRTEWHEIKRFSESEAESAIDATYERCDRWFEKNMPDVAAIPLPVVFPPLRLCNSVPTATESDPQS